MQINIQIALIVEMLDIFFQSSAPFDIIMAKFFRNHKWIGANERREIAEFIYSIFRNYEKIRFYTSEITGNFGRFFALSFLKIEKKMPDSKILEIFSGKNGSPAKLTPFEERFLSKLDVEKDLPMNAKLNYPLWTEKYFRRAFPLDQFDPEMLAQNSKASVDLRVNTLKSTKKEVKDALLASGLQVSDMRFSDVGIRILNKRIGRNHEVISSGMAEIQDEGSQLVAKICAPQSKDTVVDFCAGAGGKTLAIAALMKNRGRIFALDKYEHRLENAKIRLRRANVNNVFCQEINSKWIKRHKNCANIVLVDAPCSGTGTWRRNPDMRAKFFQKDLDELIVLQEEILASAQSLVKPGGKLIYATCSVLMEENEDQIERFLEKFPNFKYKNVEIRNGEDEQPLYSGKYLRLSPAIHETDGFFAALLVKTME